jgi:hypothetical protein
LISGFALILCGCGSDLVPVRGSVQRDGRAVPGGSVIVSPVGQGKPAVGLIQSDGSFQLTTEQPNDGAMIGQYRVTIAGERGSTIEATRTTFVGPRDLTFDIDADKENELLINVSLQDGWQAVEDD